MNGVTSVLEAQCVALEKMCAQLNNLQNSGDALQKIADAWKGSMMNKRELTLKMDMANKQMQAVSASCAEYLGDEAEERRRFLQLMNMQQ